MLQPIDPKELNNKEGSRDKHMTLTVKQKEKRHHRWMRERGSWMEGLGMGTGGIGSVEDGGR